MHTRAMHKGPSDAALFDAILEPNPPLSFTARNLLIGAVGLISLGVAGLFISQGAWPVTPFFGADVILLWWAFQANSRAARRRERIFLTHAQLRVEHIDPRGRAKTDLLESYWLRVEHHDPDLLGTELAVASRGRRIIVGSFLGAAERADLAEALRGALRRLRKA